MLSSPRATGDAVITCEDCGFPVFWNDASREWVESPDEATHYTGTDREARIALDIAYLYADGVCRLIDTGDWDTVYATHA